MAEERFDAGLLFRTSVAEDRVKGPLGVQFPVHDLLTIAVDVELRVLVEYIAARDSSTKTAWNGNFLLVLKVQPGSFGFKWHLRVDSDVVEQVTRSFVLVKDEIEAVDDVQVLGRGELQVKHGRLLWGIDASFDAVSIFKDFLALVLVLVDMQSHVVV